ncbi:phosphoinositide phosphatase SAC6-like [Nicotiana tomentosiformis]|uniref:Phosphoinositide phosphatase SAC6-like n=1 Tax=Nicotiana tabacum TaxID=4097 RepID=A0A1S4A5X9_TOBAC|nr:phosphoinositide phosphatase SAC6-like [Nicotiana tomentosiformis]XP_009601929.1 phosphoinositide phosphatase SAC6-like [Nicotiana tomentosiformis]XP_016472052.1 PREDICTED: phosphoinositide phosphatase SAC6-like [Nicotiana tabacum]XP_016472053.1 PREDICTED: phosphoinositide phosphatase SAC6-like [Nicotiana tabacum]XP_016472054.1 PREDICTED: phosphoinositide phosphatase SAC6-like [Nicotiana tabacum]
MMEKGDSSQKLYKRMRLWEFPDQYVVEPTDGSSGSCLEISRVDGSMKLIDEIPNCSSLRVPKIRTIFGVIGILKLLAGSYLLVITERESVGSYLGHPIFKVSSMKVFPCDHSLKNTPAEQKKMEAEFSALLNVAERTPGLYFSYDVNITLSAQRLHDLGDESKLLPLWRQADPRFLWNNYMMEVLIDHKLDPFLLPVVQGSFHNFQAAIGKDIVDVTLIARRCNRRTGTRMWRRGADSDGFVANFVESEQIIQLNGCTASFVQVRGSIPLLWDQVVDLTYKPKFEIVKLEEAPRVVERHFLDLRKKYGNVLSVDLVNKHGGEGRLNEKFANAMQQVVGDDVRYLHFDFHHICGHVHFERLSILYEQIEDFFIKNRYFLLNEKGEKVEMQLGVVRTNCIDCLDRTNVTQSMLARKMLEFQLRRLGVFDAEEAISTHPNLDESFKILWANHGDDISLQYSGTPALKGDFVRYGKRTVQGIVNDGWNALMRYYLNNFVDGTKQDAIDLMQGHYIMSVSRDMTATSQKGGIEAIASFPLALGLILTGLFFATLSLGRVRNDVWNLLFSLVWASISLAIAAVVKANGRMFCNRPRLHQSRR